MAFLENFGKKASEIAQAAAKKSTEIVEVTKITMNITSEEDRIKKQYTTIGQKLYEEYRSNPGQYPEFSEQFKEINALMENIRKLKSRLLDAKNMRICDTCEAEIDKKVAFCPKCGAKQEILQKDTGEGKESSGPSCPSCGAGVGEDQVFCPGCGTKLKE